MLSNYLQNQNFPDQQFGQRVDSPYVRGINTYMPQPMGGQVTEDELYPLETSLVTPQFNTPNQQQNFAGGGMAKNTLPSIAEVLRQQGEEGDTILAHINPIEAMVLKNMGGSGTINPRTGLPQFSFWNKPWKATRSSLGGIGGAVIGNMILPGIGGVIGGAIGQGAQHSMRGKSFGQGALKGGMMGAALPTAAGLAGQGLSSLGANGAGSFLSNYGTQNAILPSLGLAGESASTSGALTGGAQGIAPSSAAAEMPVRVLGNNAVQGATGQAATAAPTSFIDKLTGNASNFLSDPKNLLALGVAASSFANRPKEASPEKKAQLEKRYAKAKRLTPQERAALEADMLAERQMERRIARNQYLPEERFEVRPLHRRVNTPEQYRNTGKWLNYYDNPEMQGSPLMMKQGGMVPEISFEEEVEYPAGIGRYLNGNTKGQDDVIEAKLSDGEYVIPADVVAHAGDGNSNAGAKKFDALLRNIRKAKGGKVSLPPKARSLSSYMMR